ncbi:hypothetical protein [Labilibacter marinus]|uniref:hypothetical protein n=1 Tax=Labilibacter marinus TaxID=1477105 RepID=UPI000834D23D|nr:hypothetical protein [Labilibacter marinus]
MDIRDMCYGKMFVYHEEIKLYREFGEAYYLITEAKSPNHLVAYHVQMPEFAKERLKLSDSWKIIYGACPN